VIGAKVSHAPPCLQFQDVGRHKIAAKIIIDAQPVVFYYRRNTGKEVIQTYMSSNHSEVAET